MFAENPSDHQNRRHDPEDHCDRHGLSPHGCMGEGFGRLSRLSTTGVGAGRDCRSCFLAHRPSGPKPYPWMDPSRSGRTPAPGPERCSRCRCFPPFRPGSDGMSVAVGNGAVVEPVPRRRDPVAQPGRDGQGCLRLTQRCWTGPEQRGRSLMNGMKESANGLWLCARVIVDVMIRTTLMSVTGTISW